METYTSSSSMTPNPDNVYAYMNYIYLVNKHKEIKYKFNKHKYIIGKATYLTRSFSLL